MKRAGFIVVTGLLLAAGLWWFGRPDSGSMQVVETSPPLDDPAQIERGRYLVAAGDCVACHTAQGGVAFAGGRRMPTPYGDLWSSNLTPDPDSGIGRWSAGDFWRALHFGRSPDGRRLYPVFPYPNYTRVSREDSDAMFAYLHSLPAVAAVIRKAELRFPYNLQLAVQAWRALYFRPGEFEPRADRDEQWNRGAYLVEGLGHCNACHTARNRLGGLRTRSAYAGGPIPMLGWDALPLTSAKPMSDEEAAEMIELLHTGTSRRGVATGPMAEVVFRSLQHLDPDDIAAMVGYIRTLPHREPPRTAHFAVPEAAAKALRERGQGIYEEHCADCHGSDGSGRDHRYPALDGNSLVTSPSPTNAIQTVLYGGYGPSTATVPQPYGMPSYAHRLKPAEIAAVLSYVRSAWNNSAPAVSPAEVEGQ